MVLIFLLVSTVAFAQQSPAVFLAGAAEMDITPEVDKYNDLNGNGIFDMGNSEKAFGFGDKVVSFKDGRILVGNGRGKAEYIYDKLYAYALVLEDPKSKKRVALVGADLYLLTSADIEKIRSMVDEKYGIDFIAISPTHNHMGPDTLGVAGLDQMTVPKIINAIVKTGDVESGINRQWFEKFRNKMVMCIEQAANSMVPAHLTFAKSEFHMGLTDLREPNITDPSLNIMAVDGIDGKPIATLINWANHPESVLLYGNPDRKYDQLPYGSLNDIEKEAWGKVLTSGFPGYAKDYLRKIRGGVPLYFNGPLGGMQTPLRAILWDPVVHPQYPAKTPVNKVPKEIWIPNDFRFAPILGRELAKEALDALELKGEKATFGNIKIGKRSLLVPMENHFFRAMASLGVLGYEKGNLYNDEGQVDNNFGSWIGGLFVPGVKAYTGRNVKVEVSVINIGPAQIVNIPAEALPESIRGFPEDFATNPDKYFPNEKEHHPVGADYRLSVPPLNVTASGKFLFTFCLSGGELGYVIPKSDFKPPRDIKIPPMIWWWICFDAEVHPHYEESMSLSRDIEPIIMGALNELLKETRVEYPK